MESHFKDLRRNAQETGEEFYVRKLLAFLRLDWSSFQVGWLGKVFISRVQHRMRSLVKPGHLDILLFPLDWTFLVAKDPPLIRK